MKNYSLCNVYLWGMKVGTAAWDHERKSAFFEYELKFKKTGLELAPLMISWIR